MSSDTPRTDAAVRKLKSDFDPGGEVPGIDVVYSDDMESLEKSLVAAQKEIEELKKKLKDAELRMLLNHPDSIGK